MVQWVKATSMQAWEPKSESPAPLENMSYSYIHTCTSASRERGRWIPKANLAKKGKLPVQRDIMSQGKEEGTRGKHPLPSPGLYMHRYIPHSHVYATHTHHIPFLPPPVSEGVQIYHSDSNVEGPTKEKTLGNLIFFFSTSRWLTKMQ